MKLGRYILAGVLGIAGSCVSVDEDLEELWRDYDLNKEIKIDEVMTEEDDSERSEKEKAIRDYVLTNLEKIIGAQEKKLGIKHFGVPEIEYGFGKETHLRKAKYDCLKDKIYIYSLDIPLDEREMLSAEEILNHELGHYYADGLSEELRGESFPVEYHNNKFEYAERIGIKLASEGIAEYFRVTMSPQKDAFWSGEFPNDLNPFELTKNLYPIGLSLVYPIIEGHGVKKAVVYLTENYPRTIENILDLDSWQKGALEELEFAVE